MQNATVGDLELRLLDPKGPLQDHFRSPLLKFYTRNETSKELDMHLQISKLDEELYIHESAVGIWLEKWPDTGKFLEAMRYNKFDPRSPNFEISWKARTVPEVSPRKALGLVREVLHGPPSNAETECRFVKVFGKLTAGMESWDKFDLALLQNFDPGLKHFKHLVCQHYVDLARFVATTLVSTDQPLPPIMAFFKIGCNVAGHDWPWPFNGNQGVQNSLRFSDVSPSFRWSFISRALRFWEWDYLQKGLHGFKLDSEVDRQEPEDFPKLHPDEVLQMLHVQLRLSSCNVAEVQGRLSEAGAGSCMWAIPRPRTRSCSLYFLNHSGSALRRLR
eukprot:Skav231751  [mRNA]  locus=scaffold695:22032:23027:- [translate_table: standard]